MSTVMKARKARTGTSVVAAVALSALLLGACVPPGPPATWTNGNVDQFAEYVTGVRINEARRAHGRPELWSHGVLVDKARQWSQQMANGRCAPSKICHSQLSHGISGRVSWTSLGENVGIGSNLDSLWNAFMNSPSHRANILDGRWHYYGVGVVRVGGSFWVTMVFMRI